MKFIEIPTNSIKRIQSEEICVLCNSSAIWSIFGPRSDEFLVIKPNTPQHMCSRCILYESKWGLKNKEYFINFLSLVEEENKKLTYEDSKLILSDADQMLSAIVFSNAFRNLSRLKK